MPVATTEDEAWTDKDVARFFKITPRTVWLWTKNVPDFPKPRKLRGLTRWSKREVQQFFSPVKP